jgi:hypothetical protein
MLQLGKKSWNLAFNAPGSRLIKVIIQVKAVKIYVAAVEALRQKERQAETQSTTKIDGFLSFSALPPWMLMYFFAGFLGISLCVWPHSNSGFCCFVCFPLRIVHLKIGKSDKLRNFLYTDFLIPD